MHLPVRRAALALALTLSSAVALDAAAQSGQSSTSSQTPQTQTPVRVPGSSVTVTAQKEPADPAALPVSVTAVPEDLLKSAGVTFVSDAAMFSPNTHFTEFTARKLSNPRIRGVGSSPANPGVVTYVDGVPQLNSNTSSFDLIDVDQIEFVRGPQSLFGRNALGGLINITSARPSMTKWGGNASVPFGTDGMFDLRADVSGPVSAGKVAAGFSMAFSRRDGFSTNTVSGNDIDSREGFSAKGQLLFTPNAQWEARVILGGERARDGDYALNDLNAVRTTPFDVSRDFEGFTNRDLFTTTILARREGKSITFTSTTGIIDWKTVDETDLDYSFFPAATRANTEEAMQFSQEVRFASAVAAPVKFGSSSLRWQAGALVFTQGFDQLATNAYGPFVLSQFINFPVVETSPAAALDDTGISLYGQATMTFAQKLDLSFGARFDRENRDASLTTSYSPAIAAPVVVNESRDFTDVSPQVAVAYRVHPGTLFFGTVSRAFKAGGFNPISIPGSESYNEEHAWNVEAGVKHTHADGRLSMSASIFSIDWDDLQLNLPIPQTLGQFYISNIGGATSRGVEFEITARPRDGVDVFAAVGFTRARFSEGTSSMGVNVSDHKIQNTPAYTAAFGAQVSRALRGGRAFGRIDIAVTGAFEYDEFNTARQDDYALANLRAGWSGKLFTVEAWVRNVADTKYIPLAFAFQSASGFLAEPGRPRTAGVTVRVGF